MAPIKSYHRPSSIEDALQLLSRPGINTAVIGGGTHIIPHMNEMIDEVVDLQKLGLTQLSYTGKGLTLGATVTLQSIVDDDRAPTLLRETARSEGPNTLRHVATVGGSVIAPSKSSEFVAALLVFEAEIQIRTVGNTKTIPLSDFLLDAPAALGGGLVTAISLATLGETARARVGRTPVDTPIVAAVGRLIDSGDVRLALCGVANTPVLVEPDNVKAAVNPASDFRGSREYRRQMAALLAKRVVNEIMGE